MYAEEARKKFWEALRTVLKEEGEPFYFTENKQWAIINKESYNFHEPCIAVDFLWRYEILRINVYIENNIWLYNQLKLRKKEIEHALGFAPVWQENDFNTHGGKGENTRRIKVEIPFDNTGIVFRKLAKEAVPIIKKYVEVFRGI